jgi:hypothetical protein
MRDITVNYRSTGKQNRDYDHKLNPTIDFQIIPHYNLDIASKEVSLRWGSIEGEQG